MKKIIQFSTLALFTFLFSTLLSGCGFSDESSAGSMQVYQGVNFTMKIKSDWKIVPSAEMQNNVPQETLVGFTSPEAYDGFFLNVSVLKEQLQAPTSSVDYGRANLLLAEENLTDYKKVDEAAIDLNGTSALVHIFEARLNPNEEKLTRYIQLYTTQGSEGYIVTGGMLPSTPEEMRDEVGAMVTSFRVI